MSERRPHTSTVLLSFFAGTLSGLAGGVLLGSHFLSTREAPPKGAPVEKGGEAEARLAAERDAAWAEAGALRGRLAELEREAALREQVARQIEAPVAPTIQDTAAVRARVEALAAALEEARAKGDKDAFLPLLAELSRLGEPAFPAMADMIDRCVRSPKPIPYSWQWRSLFPTAFFVWALDQPSSSKRLREDSILEIRTREPDRIAERFSAARILAESDPMIAKQMLYGYSARPADPAAVAQLLRVAREGDDLALKALAADHLGFLRGEGAARAAEELSRASPDPAVRAAARCATLMLHPSETGLLVNQGPADGGGGLRKGDLILTVDGKPADMRDLYRKDGRPLVLEILRDGSRTSVTISGYPQGVQFWPVKKK